jgi:peptide/nickel transport system permease protein
MAIPTSSIDAVTLQGAVAEPEPLGTVRRRRLPLFANRKAAAGLLMLAFFLLIAVIGSWIAPYDPTQRGPDLVQPPSSAHWFGTSHLGQDIFSQVLVGTRSVIFVGFLAGLVATALSVLIGVTAGYLGGVADDGLSAVSNVFLVIPALPSSPW